MRIPLVDLRAAYTPIQEALAGKLTAVFDDMQLLLGPNVQAFEHEFAAYCAAAHGIGVSSGTDALFAALRACGVGPGDEVIVPSLTFFATIGAIVHTGATPVLVDVEPETLTIDVDEIRAALTPSTRAIVPVHLYGHPADMDPIVALARENGLRVVEDCAQAHGARYNGYRCGSLGDVACFSFYYTKNLGALGEAGFITTNDPEIANHVRLLRNHGHASKFEHAIIGHNFRLDEIQAAVLRLKLPGLDAGNARRRAIARRYAARLRNSGARLPGERAGSESVYHLFPIRVGARDALHEYLGQHGIGTGIHYKIPGHLQPALSEYPHRVRKMDVTERACRELLSLPIYPELSDTQVDYIVEQVMRFIERDPTQTEFG